MTCEHPLKSGFNRVIFQPSHFRVKVTPPKLTPGGKGVLCMKGEGPLGGGGGTTLLAFGEGAGVTTLLKEGETRCGVVTHFSSEGLGFALGTELL